MKHKENDSPTPLFFSAPLLQSRTNNQIGVANRSEDIRLIYSVKITRQACKTCFP